MKTEMMIVKLNFVGLALLLMQSAFGQLKEGISLPDLMMLKPSSKAEATQASTKTSPLDGPVVPSEYYVGPGDYLALNIWSSAPVEHMLTVSPEGTLLIPNVGIFSVNDLTLEEAKKRTSQLVGKKYPNADISLTLLSPRRVLVEIMGQVFNEGRLEMSSVQRVDNLIAQANMYPISQGSDKYLNEMLPYLRASASERRITLHRKNGSVISVDLKKYQITGQGKYNPYVREGDVVHVPKRSDLDRSIGIFGGTRQFGSFEFVSGDSLTDLIKMGLGFKPAADSTLGILSRLTIDGASMETVYVNPVAIADGVERNIALRPGDRLNIPEVPDARQGYIIQIEGEVGQPGVYPITQKNTKLSAAINAAGGLTRDANLRAATIIRQGDWSMGQQERISQEQLLSMRASLDLEDTTYYSVETALRIKGELVSVDFHRLFVQGDSTQDVTLRSGDRIRVPARQRTVYVFGQVASPGHVPFVEGRGFNYYVDQASGYTNEARSGDVKVIKGGTRVWLDPGETTIEDGDFIWVPKEIHRPFAYYVTTYAQIFSIIGVVATVALLINSIK